MAIEIQVPEKTGDYGFVRVAAAVPSVNVADVRHNVESILSLTQDAIEKGAQMVVFPEMSVTGYTCADLLGNELLLDAAERALADLTGATAQDNITLIVGAPLRWRGHLFNCAVVINAGRMWVVPKTYIPNYKEFYEKRWFSSACLVGEYDTIEVCGREVLFGTDLLFELGRACVAVELCEDLWVPLPPSTQAAVNGANVIVNLSASNELVGKHERLMGLITHQSDRCIAAYVYASAGYGESTTDLVFAGNAAIAENGAMLAQCERFTQQSQLVIADVDIQLLMNERRVNTSFADSARGLRKEYRMVKLRCETFNYDEINLQRQVRQLPFVPTGDEHLSRRCEEIVNIQTEGLMRRLDFTGIEHLVVGVSGGLDSTLALMVAVRAFDRLGINRSQIHGITMPGFGTTGRTRNNAVALMEALGVTTCEISIAAAVSQHFADIGQDPESHDVTYENSQARERTQILMDYANKVNGLVLGTGDLSELALGWATYNGDHMSMYNVNAGIPKTLARHLVMWFAAESNSSNPEALRIHETLLDVLHTPISPELTPADEHGNIKQVTEDIVGPYELHDFFLYNMLRHGFAPRKIFFLARHAFDGRYNASTIKKWLTVFSRRFFQQQFKRSCLPDGPKVGSVSLSPRGDWRMPSDASAKLWMRDCMELPE